MVSLGDVSQEKQLKIVILGEPACGKSSLVLRYCHDEFSRQYYPTEGVDVLLKRTLVESRSIRLIIWDISGSSLSSSLLDKYLYNANAVLLLYDITNIASFNALTSWYAAVENIISKTKGVKPLVYVIANKCDIEHQRAVPNDRQNKFVNEYQLTAFNVSTRSGENVCQCFQRIIAQLLGIKLSKNEFDAHQKLVKAEIFVNQAHQVVASQQNPSSICRIQ